MAKASKLLPAVLVAAACLGGCESLPSDGPSASAISAETTAPPDLARYAVFDLTEPMVARIGPWRPRGFAANFTIRPGGSGKTIGIGDTLAIQILEAGDNGLFANTKTRGAAFTLVVDETGQIFVPFVGRIRADGRSIDDLRGQIQKSMEDKAIQPQVIIGVTTNQSNAVTLVGDVNAPGRYPISIRGTKVLDMVALAGGSKYPTFQTFITLKRKGISASILLEDLFAVPENNVYLAPDDDLLFSFSPMTYTVLGSVTTQGQKLFETKRVTLAEAIGAVGGLGTLQADASGVFLFRYEQASLIRPFKPDLPPGDEAVPTVYRLDLKSSRGLFIAKSLWLRDKDLVYVATAPSVEFMKFLAVVNAVGRTAQTAASGARSIQLIGQGR